MDEIFGAENFVSLIPFRTKTSKIGSKTLYSVFDFLIWYAKDKESIKYHKLYGIQNVEGDKNWAYMELSNGERRAMSREEIDDHSKLPKGARVFRVRPMVPTGFNPKGVFEVCFQGKIYGPPGPKGRESWNTTKEKVEKLIADNRLMPVDDHLEYIYYADDFPYSALTNNWSDTRASTGKVYVVQTSNKVIQRCMLMTTDPGDLVFDPTCGSGTTAFVAEQWGRRWITCDVSRVPLALARQRLLTSAYDYYSLQDEGRGPASGFVYNRKTDKKGADVGGIVSHVTLESIVNDKPPAEELIVDNPEKDSKKVRVSGPFCMEAIMPPPLTEHDNETEKSHDHEHIERMRGRIRQSPNIHLPGGKIMKMENIRIPAKGTFLHAEASINGELAAIMFGAHNSAISEQVVIEAAREARVKKFSRLVAIGFAIEPAARRSMNGKKNSSGIPAIYVQASTDLIMDDLLKNMHSSQIFAVCGQPDVNVAVASRKQGECLYQAQLCGLDVFDPETMETEHKKGSDVPCWMLDTDYDGQCFRSGQVFFPRTEAWKKISKDIKAEFDDSVWEHLSGDTSAPFPAGEYRQIAVKVIDDRGNELLVVKSLDGAK